MVLHKDVTQMGFNYFFGKLLLSQKIAFCHNECFTLTWVKQTLDAKLSLKQYAELCLIYIDSNLEDYVLQRTLSDDWMHPSLCWKTTVLYKWEDVFSEGVERWHTRDEQYLPRKCSCAACQGLKGLGGRSPNPETRESYPLHMGCPWTGQGGKRCRITHRGQSQTSTVVKMEKRKKCEHKVSTGGKVSKVMEKYGMTGRERKRMDEGNGEERQISPD